MNWQYIRRFPAWFVVVLLRYPAAVVAVLLFSSEDKRSLARWKWLETIDNDLTGDGGWKSEHIGNSDPLKTWNRIRWLWRNGGNRFNYFTIGLSEFEALAVGFWIKNAVPLWGGRFLDLRFGWNASDSKQGRCKYVFTIRVKTKP